MTALPVATDFTDPATTQGGAKTFITSLRAFLAGIVGTAGTPASARAALEIETRATVASAASTADIWAATGRQINWTGTTTCTGFPAAPQAGAYRVLVCAGAAPFTAGANMLIAGYPSGATVTLAANDRVTVEAITTTQFKLEIERYNGEAAGLGARTTVASAATTAAIWDAAGSQIDWTGTTTCTGFPAAPQAGAKKTLICAAAAPFTAGANMLITGYASGATFTASANDKVIVEAITTTQFHLTIQRYDGRAAKANPRVNSTASSATPTINTDTTDLYQITALAAAITSMTTNLSGTPTDGQVLVLEITDNGTARAITWGASFESSGNSTLPTTTVLSVKLTIVLMWNSATSKWRCVGVA